MKILTCFMYPSYGTATLNGCDVFTDPLAIKACWLPARERPAVHGPQRDGVPGLHR
jgi:hypothetical protein